jgi:outer membrane cobalamin receptor
MRWVVQLGFSALFVALSLGWPSAASATDESPEQAPGVLVEEPPEPQPERDITASSDVIPLGVAGPPTFLDALRGRAGVQLRSDGGFGRRISLSFRGTDNQQALVLVDDIPLNSALGGGFDLSLLDVAGFSRMEVYRGSSALFGGAALGGVVRLVPSGAPAALPSGAARLLTGAFGTFQLSGASSVPWQSGHATAAWTLRQSSGDFVFLDTNGAERQRQNNDSRGLSLHLTANQRLTEAWTLDFIALGHLEARGIPGVEQFPTPGARQDTRFSLLSIKASGELHRTALRLQAWHRLQSVNFSDPSPAFPPPIRNEQLGQAVGTSTQAQWLFGAHALTARFEASHEWANLEQTRARSSRSRQQAAVVAHYEVWLLHDLLTLHAAARAEGITDIGAVLLPELGLVLRPGAGFTLRARGARSFRLPSFEELYFDSGAIRGNPNLNPEDAWGADIGVAWEVPWLSAEVSAFWQEIDNLILFLPKTALLIEATDSKAARSRGVEVEVKARPWAWLEASASYTFVDARFVDTHLRLPARSPHLTHASVRVMPLSELQFTAELEWQSASFLDRFESLTEEARLLVHAALAAQPLPWLSLEVRATNLTNKRDAVDALQYPLPGRAWFSSAAIQW